jgi:hypothetical protein
VEAISAEAHTAIDEALRPWRQGDCVLGDHGFIYRTSLVTPLTEAGRLAAVERLDTAESSVPGLMVVSQTCDLVRSCRDRPFVEVSPLCEVKESDLRQIERSRIPRYAFISSLAARCLVADLDRVMTVEKSVVAGWVRVKGCQTSADVRRLTQALARKRARSAFPDDFVEFAKTLTGRLVEKHDRQSEEGRALRALREIRVRAEPSWEAPQINLSFWFIPNDDQAMFEGKRRTQFLKLWEAWVAPAGRFEDVQVVVQSLGDLTAAEYVESDLLDLDHLTTRDEGSK